MTAPRVPIWSPTFITYGAYVFIIITYKLGVASVVMGAGLLFLLLQREPLRVPHFLWLFLAWILWGAVGYFTTPYGDVVGPEIVQQAKLVLVALVAVNALRTPAQIRLFLMLVLVSYVLFPVRATLVNYFVHHYTQFGRAIGPFIYQNSNDLAAITILMLAAALALWTSEPRRTPAWWLGLGCAVVFVLTILLTQSRGAVLALGAIGMPSALALARRRPRLVPVFAALVGVALYLAPAGLWERMAGLGKATSVATIGEMDPEGSARDRWAVIQTASRIIADHPLTGVGLGAYRFANFDYNPMLGRLDTHNTYLNVAAETGIPGLAIFLTLVCSVVRGARRVRWTRPRGSPGVQDQGETLHWLYLGLVAFLIAAVFGSFAKLALVYVYLSLLWCAAQAVRAPDAAAAMLLPDAAARGPDPRRTPVAAM
jgi:O-antigen ligase